MWVVFACSGPGASEAMARASFVGLACLLVTVLLTAAAIRAWLPLTGSLRKVAALVGLLLIPAHPTLWLGVSSGDCGQMLLVLAPVVTLVHGLAAAFLIAKGKR